MKYPFMPLFLGDLLADTLNLSAQEFGAYILLILHAWKHEAMIPCAQAQKIARVNNYHWQRVRKAIEPFFEVRGDTSDVVHPMYYHARVHRELTSAGEISNKRKEAAEQMHAKRRASASVLHTHPHSQSLRESSNGKLREAQNVQMHSSQSPNWRPRIDDEVRSPPRTKSDNELKPIPDKPLKQTTDKPSAELSAVMAAKSNEGST